MDKNHKMNIYIYFFFDKRDRNYVTHRQKSEIQNALLSKRRTLLSLKVVNRFKVSTSYA